MITTDFVSAVKKFEGFSATPYTDASGTVTIGYGRTENITNNEITTIEQETYWLGSKLTNIYKQVEKYCKSYELSNNQLLALTDFTYNLGFGNLKKLTANCTRTVEEIANHITLYNKCNGIPLTGLTKRRYWEKELFTSDKVKISDEKIIQDSINIFLEKHGSTTKIEEDGIIGRKTIAALHEVFSLL